MDAAAPRPSSYAITAETTGLDVDPDLAGHGMGRDLVLHLTVTETHKWFGIGGWSALLRRPRSLRRQAWTALPCPAAGYLLCSGECRRLMVRLTTQELRKDEALRRMIPMAYCNDAVPTGVEALVAERAAALTTDSCRRACRCEVVFRIDIELVYDEVEVLLQACADAGELSGAGDGDGDGDAPPCAICFEEMAPGAEEMMTWLPGCAEETTTWLPGCGHGFHDRFIGGWFEKASTCPVCRRDKLRYLPPAYRAVRDMFLPDPEGE